MKNTLAPAAKNFGEFILICDNLTTQISEQFLSEVQELSGIVWFGVKDATNIWQPGDNSYGALYKRLISQIQDEWLESDENVDLWLGNSGEKTRRILITHWVGEAHERLQSEEYNKTRYRCYEKTGCLVTADGSNGAKINHEGLHDYVVAKT